MEGNKLDISCKNNSEPTHSSYKPIPEKDMEEQAVSRPKSLVKTKSNPEVDGADEKMLPEDKPAEIIVNSEKSPQNGDAKLDIMEVKNAFVGLTKEELMKYANDPFWVRLRWFLFITFWLLWAAMLIGAVLIIYAAPKCDPPPPRTWWQKGPLTKMQDIKMEIVKNLDENVQGVIIPWPVDNYEPIDEKSGVVEAINAVKKKGANVIIELQPAISNVWFNKSENKDPAFIDYYIWRAGTNQVGSLMAPPNNWVSQKNVSSWKYSEIRKEYYYSPFDKPHLNFRNREVVQEFTNVINKFLTLNVSGISLLNAEFLFIDSNFENEDTINLHTTVGHTQYAFYKHTKTENLPEVGELLKQWRSVIRNSTENGPLMVSNEVNSIESYKVNDSLVIDLPLKSNVFSKPTFIVSEAGNTLNYTFNIDNIEWPLWEAKSEVIPKDALNILTYLLPGAPLINVDEKIDPLLLKIRDSPSIMRGICGVYSLVNETVLAFFRVTPGSPGIFVALNPGNEVSTINIPKEIPPLAKLEEVTVRYYSKNYNETEFLDIGVKQKATAVPVSPKSAVVLEYVPKREE
ncbi:hypothetical protein GWI33_022744 [Rhynchophorus ferrugineus]|uniref:alpha-glucosidase n=1 Tax=Rhynchophorus ferrugineus TaxID=354439 RepID=A0A834IU11_RHYFE|nr:hypothetical protein GWI33_022744 [Rhynchophorus ferrugineus]